MFWKPASTTNNSWALRGEDGGDDNAPLLFAPPSTFPSSSSQTTRRPPPSLAKQRLLLPIYKHKRQIVYAVETHGVTVIVGETGCGKSSQIPQYLVDSGGWTQNDFTVVCTQPRRIAASSLATRVAQERNCPLGDQVGYTVRFDDQTSPQTVIKVSFLCEWVCPKGFSQRNAAQSSYIPTYLIFYLLRFPAFLYNK
jgi:ATP-dependent RNA helicase DDX35